MHYSIYTDGAFIASSNSLAEACSTARTAALNAPGDELIVENRDNEEVAKYVVRNGALKAWVR